MRKLIRLIASHSTVGSTYNLSQLLRHVSRQCLLTSFLDALAGAQTVDMASSCIADSDAAVLDLPGLGVASEAFAAETAELPSSLFAGSLEELAYTYVSSVAIKPLFAVLLLRH